MSILKNTLLNIIGRKQNPILQLASDFPNIDEILQEEGGSIVCFVGPSEGDALRNHTKESIRPLTKYSNNIFIIDLCSENWRITLAEALKEPVWFAFSFFGVGQEISLYKNNEYVNLWQEAKIPFIRVFGDIPAYFPDKHVGKYTNSINLYGDRRFANFYSKWFEDRALTITPPNFPISVRDLQDIDYNSKKIGTIIFPKNGNSPANLITYWRSALPPAVSKLLEAVAETCTSRELIDNEVEIDVAILSYSQDLGVYLETNRVLMCFLVAQLDDYLRRYKSTLIAEAILNLPVIIRGKNWEHVDFIGKRARLDSDSDFAATEPLLDRAPAMIDMSPNTVTSPHDRVFRAVGRGTAFLTNKQQYLEKLVFDQPGCTFCFNKNSIHDLVEHYVLNPTDAIEMGIRQSNAFRSMYPETAFTEVVMTALQLVSLRLGKRPWGTQNFVDYPPGVYR